MKSTLNPVLFLLLLCGVFSAEADEVKTVSVMEGDSVTLNPDPTKIQGINDILWWFGDGPVIAQLNLKEISYPHHTERFRDRLQLDHQNGSLTINNMRINDSGLYKLKISQNSGTLRMTFSVTVSAPPLSPDDEDPSPGDPGLSSGAKAGIVVVLLLVFAVAAAGVFYYRHIICSPNPLLDVLSKQISETSTDVEEEEMIPKQPSKTYDDKTISAKEGESVTLNTDAEIQKDDQIQWMFGPQENLIAEIKGETREISTYVADGRFRDRLKLDKTTGSLTITNTTAEHIGVYKLQTISNRGTLNQRFIVTVKIACISVVEGEPVTLYPDTEIQKDDLIMWMFGDENYLIAEKKTGKTRETHEGPGGRFRDRLKLDKRTGSLTIESTRTEHSGLYKLQISSQRGTTNKTFKVAIKLKKVSAKEGKSVTLRTNAAIQRNDELLWLFGDENSVIAEIKGGIGKICTFDVADGRFRDRLQLEENTGSLTIRNITTEHAGVYTLRVISRKLTKIMRFNVTVRVLKTIGMRGKTLILKYREMI